MFHARRHIMPEESFEDFLKAAIKTFGKEKVSGLPIKITQEHLDKMNEQLQDGYKKEGILGPFYKKEDFENQAPQVWLIGELKCPGCGTDLLGLFGSFTWDIRHGEGHCSDCKQVTFRYYHYFGQVKRPIQLFSIIMFD